MKAINAYKPASLFMAAILGWLFASGAAAEGDARHGEEIYQQSCFTCHDTSIHTRKDRIIFSKVALRNRVEFCEANAGANWSQQDITDVTEYLNEAFYKFDD
jgi:hypothetical protein